MNPAWPRVCKTEQAPGLMGLMASRTSIKNTRHPTEHDSPFLTSASFLLVIHHPLTKVSSTSSPNDLLGSSTMPQAAMHTPHRPTSTVPAQTPEEIHQRVHDRVYKYIYKRAHFLQQFEVQTRELYIEVSVPRPAISSADTSHSATPSPSI